MKYIIPAKSNSERCPNKNWRPFYGDKSLVDICVGKLLAAGAASDDIWIYADSGVSVSLLERMGVPFIIREKYFELNGVPIGAVLQDAVRQMPELFDSVCIVHVTTPLFDQFSDFIDSWDPEKYDSATVVYPITGYVLDESHRPMGWGFGPWHSVSQDLPARFATSFCASIIKRETLARHEYYFGSNVQWFHADGPFVDIDTEADFELARVLYVNKLQNEFAKRNGLISGGRCVIEVPRGTPAVTHHDKHVAEAYPVLDPKKHANPQIVGEARPGVEGADYT